MVGAPERATIPNGPHSLTSPSTVSAWMRKSAERTTPACWAVRVIVPPSKEACANAVAGTTAIVLSGRPFHAPTTLSWTPRVRRLPVPASLMRVSKKRIAAAVSAAGAPGAAGTTL